MKWFVTAPRKTIKGAKPKKSAKIPTGVNCNGLKSEAFVLAEQFALAERRLLLSQVDL